MGDCISVCVCVVGKALLADGFLWLFAGLITAPGHHHHYRSFPSRFPATYFISGMTEGALKRAP